MLVIAAGCAGFALLSAADELSLKGLRVARGLAFAAASILMAGALVMAAASPDRWSLPLPARVAGWLVGAVSLALLVLSLGVEVSTPRAYLDAHASAGPPRPGLSAPRLVTTGTYALCRHPGVLWFSLLMAALVLITGSRVLALAAPFWIGLDVAHVAVQERRFLVPVYGEEYRAYQARVPMIWPTITSIRRGIATLTHGRRTDDRGNT